MDQAVDLANATSYGLGSAVFSKARGLELARRLRSGMTSINGVISFAVIPALPFGGIGDSGFGRIHGEDGLKEFTNPKAIARQRMKPLLALTSFSRTAKADASSPDDHRTARRRDPAAQDPRAGAAGRWSGRAASDGAVHQAGVERPDVLAGRFHGHRQH